MFKIAQQELGTIQGLLSQALSYLNSGSLRLSKEGIGKTERLKSYKKRFAGSVKLVRWQRVRSSEDGEPFEPSW